MPVFFGAQKIPLNFLVHDVCVWIKKFFREIKKPLFCDYSKELRIIKFANDFGVDSLFKPLMALLESLPMSHMGALGYLMRCLREVCLSTFLYS